MMFVEKRIFVELMEVNVCERALKSFYFAYLCIQN